MTLGRRRSTREECATEFLRTCGVSVTEDFLGYFVVALATLPRTRYWGWRSSGRASSRLASIFLSKLSSAQLSSSSLEVLTRGIRPVSRACETFLLPALLSTFVPELLIGLLVVLSKLRRRFSLKTPLKRIYSIVANELL